MGLPYYYYGSKFKDESCYFSILARLQKKSPPTLLLFLSQKRTHTRFRAIGTNGSSRQLGTENFSLLPVLPPVYTIDTTSDHLRQGRVWRGDFFFFLGPRADTIWGILFIFGLYFCSRRLFTFFWFWQLHIFFFVTHCTLSQLILPFHIF